MLHFHRTMRNATGALAKISNVRVHEGASTVIHRADGTQQDTRFEQLSATFTTNADELEDKPAQQIFDKLGRAAAEMADQQSRIFFERLHETLEGAGQGVDARGRIFDEAFFEALEKIFIDFNERGDPEWPEFFAGIDAAQKFADFQDKLRSDPELQARFKLIMDQKRMDWRDRENSRKLVG